MYLQKVRLDCLKKLPRFLRSTVSGGRWNVYCFLRLLPRRINLEHSIDLMPRPPSHWCYGAYISRISVRRFHFRRARWLRCAAGRSMANRRCAWRPYGRRIRQHRNRRNPRDAQDRIQQRTILRAQPRHFRLQRTRVPGRRNSPPNLTNVHSFCSGRLTARSRSSLNCRPGG